MSLESVRAEIMDESVDVESEKESELPRPLPPAPHLCVRLAKGYISLSDTKLVSSQAAL